MTRPKWLTVAMVNAIHDEAIYESGDLPELVTLRCWQAPWIGRTIVWPMGRRAQLFALAAALCVGIAKNHPFNDGNKRTALLAARAFLYLSGRQLEPRQDDEVLAMVAVADGSMDEERLGVVAQTEFVAIAPLTRWGHRSQTMPSPPPSPASGRGSGDLFPLSLGERAGVRAHQRGCSQDGRNEYGSTLTVWS